MVQRINEPQITQISQILQIINKIRICAICVICGFFKTFAFCVICGLLPISCEQATEHTAPPIYDRDSVSMMTSYGVVQAYVQADSAWYYDQQKLWHLRGRVRIRNVNGLVYTSEELFWDGIRHELYSNVFSRVVTPERQMEGTYFLSDERMSHYTVSNSKGSFEKSDMLGEDDKKDETTSPADTTKAPEPILRPKLEKSRRHSSP